jgi:hypothetical protein
MAEIASAGVVKESIMKISLMNVVIRTIANNPSGNQKAKADRQP